MLAQETRDRWIVNNRTEDGYQTKRVEVHGRPPLSLPLSGTRKSPLRLFSIPLNPLNNPSLALRLLLFSSLSLFLLLSSLSLSLFSLLSSLFPPNSRCASTCPASCRCASFLLFSVRFFYPSPPPFVPLSRAVSHLFPFHSLACPLLITGTSQDDGIVRQDN